MIVTKEFKKALKKMESMVVRLDDEYCMVELSKGHSDRVRITFEDKQRIKNQKSFFFLMYCQRDVLPMLHAILKPNDELVFRSRNNNNQYQTDAGLFQDELCISVYRNEKLVIYDLVIDTSTCPNNSARAIKG